MRSLFTIFCLFVLNAFLFASVSQQTNNSSYSNVKRNEIVVKFDVGILNQIDIERALTEGRTGIAALDALAESKQVKSLVQRFPLAKIKDIYGEPINLRGWFKIHFTDSVDVISIVQQYKLLNGVVNAETIGTHSFAVTPNDPNFTGGDMWYLDQVSDYDIDAPEAWDIARGNTSVIVADLDSGFRYYHKDLGGANADFTSPQNSAGNMWINPGESGALYNNGTDDDGNGKIDDWIGWDFVTGNPQTFSSGDDYDVEDNDPRDHNGHGTHTAGTIGAISNNGLGVSSVAGGNGESGGVGNGIKVMGLRIGWTDFFGFTGIVGMDFAANALIYAADNGARIASCSWGSSNTGGLEDAINYFLYGTTSPTGSEPQLRLIFKAAGNDDDELSDYMLDRPDVIGVASTDQNDIKSDFSTYGTWVDISAPGTDIMSTYHDSNDPSNDYIALSSGTSMATPCVASVAALVMSHNNALSAAQVEQILYTTADNIYGLPGNSAYAGKLGAGRVNAYAAVNQADQALPVELVSFSAALLHSAVKLDWSTASEVNNVGFSVLRSTAQEGDYSQITHYNNNESLRGLGTSSHGKNYSYIDHSVIGGQHYWYKIEDTDISGNITEHGPISVLTSKNSGIVFESGTIPDMYDLSANFPNPFNPTTSFNVSIPRLDEEMTQISIAVYNLLGKKVKSIFNGALASGIYTFKWNGRSDYDLQVPSGMYIYRMQSESYSASHKMVLMK